MSAKPAPGAEVALVHGTTIAVEGQGALIIGPAGSGKSGLALQLMALGAGLVADDQTEICLRDGVPFASCPPVLKGKIEARFVGLLEVVPVATAPVRLVIDLGQLETQRLPPYRATAILGCEVAMLLNSETLHFPAAIMQYLRGGRSA